MSNRQAMALVAALIHVPLALTVWSLLHRRWRALPLHLWVAGALALGVGATLFCAEGSLPGWATHELANALLSVAPALRIVALRLDMDWKPRGGLFVLLCGIDFGIYLYSIHAMREADAVMLGYISMPLWTLVFAWHAAAAGRLLHRAAAGCWRAWRLSSPPPCCCAWWRWRWAGRPPRAWATAGTSA